MRPPVRAGMAPLTVDDVQGALERLGHQVRRVGGYYQAQCPAHLDRHPSLIFGDGVDGAFLRCMAGCETKNVRRALGVSGTALPLSPEERERRRAEDEAERDARAARARACWEAARVHPDRRRALEHFAPALKWNTEDLLRRGVGWDGKRAVFPIVDDAGDVIGADRYAPPNSAARRAGEAKLKALGARGLWPAPATVDGSPTLLVEGCPAAATVLAHGLPCVGFPNAAGARRCDAERLQAAGSGSLVVLADADAVGRRAASVSVLVLHGLGIHARAVDLFPERDDGRDVADELRARADGVDWLLGELAELGITTKEER